MQNALLNVPFHREHQVYTLSSKMDDLFMFPSLANSCLFRFRLSMISLTKWTSFCFRTSGSKWLVIWTNAATVLQKHPLHDIRPYQWKYNVPRMSSNVVKCYGCNITRLSWRRYIHKTLMITCPTWLLQCETVVIIRAYYGVKFKCKVRRL